MNADAMRGLFLSLALCAASFARAEGFAGLGDEARGFAEPQPGHRLVFPRDHGAHPQFRIEWWYLTANLKDESGKSYGAQWTLFRHARAPQDGEGWDSPQAFVAHAAVTTDTLHLFAETRARGGVGQAGVEAAPFRAFIDNWSFSATESNLSGASIAAVAPRFRYTLALAADEPLALHGEAGFSRKSESGQASYYYSQPFFRVEGALAIDGADRKVTGRAWMDHEWSSRPLAADQKGWDWFSLHLDGGAALMLFRLRSDKTLPFVSGSFISADGATRALARDDIFLEPLEQSLVSGRLLPIRWRVRVASLRLDIEAKPLNSQSFMGTGLGYFEGPIAVFGSHRGEGYLEMTGY
ncbi:iron ABC transporter permease [Methylosinus sporium]|uniref:Iron ABC transporter permease n=1 Tax=Methylosinus sporium TaxID=428 RepID=A0A549SD79_METSR|nr:MULTISPECIES: lipocalin-like domain-containing protein [Methylosinus]MBU3889610.1 iron ABC transporter permease [Methylosinus sp. KRF6]TRL25501.1 iron ABC transporter permease [Methylosinus sporium]